MVRRGFGFVAAWIATMTALPAGASQDMFAGKSLAIIIGFGSGGGYDLWGRTLARHIGRHLPGRPAVVPQNLLGAGSLNAANHLYAVAPKDGTAIGIIARDAVLLRCSARRARASTRPSSRGSARRPWRPMCASSITPRACRRSTISWRTS
jgi:tripartite-type tricarboxylate transporter receptor subunit TctC